MVLERCTNAVATPFGVTGALLRNDIDLVIISHWNKHLFVGTGKMTTPIYQ